MEIYPDCIVPAHLDLSLGSYRLKTIIVNNTCYLEQ